jgi:type II secretory pathway component PulM
MKKIALWLVLFTVLVGAVVYIVTEPSRRRANEHQRAQPSKHMHEGG